MMGQTILHTIRRYRTLQTHRISALPIVILMPHSSCNCRCVMCDIWKGNKNLRQLTEEDVSGLLGSLKSLGTRQVLMSGGEALLHPAFFSLCELLKKSGHAITLLSTGLTLKKHAHQLLQSVDEIIISLDGDETTHDAIRNIPGAFAKLKEGVQYIKSLHPYFRISARTVIHRLNFRNWLSIVESAREIGVDSISFLPADVSSSAFNREQPWDAERQNEVALAHEELDPFKLVLDELIETKRKDFETGFILESPAKLTRMYQYFRAIHGLDDFPYKKCNAPWVSTVIEPDGTVRPCFFHEAVGNIKSDSLGNILNGEKALSFRKQLNMLENETCKRCVCYLHLSPGRSI
jgi:MoaA/NifB/PqqE/SkfB family radical SAM enzyme